MKLNCLIVDDEPVARNGMEEYVKEVDFLNLVGKCENPLKASAYLKEHKIDLMLLDIHMPKITGIEFLKTLKDPPMVILTTAFSEYALEGYSLDIIDYLVKPVSFDRFLRAVQKASDFHALKHQSKNSDQGYFFVKCDSKYERINFSDVLFVESLQNYVVIHTLEKKYITYLTLSAVEEQLPGAQFIKIHKSYFISMNKVKAIEGNEIVLINGHHVPISRALKDDVMNRIMGNNLLRRGG
jgi:DNA-binding LytR/AlgR family response regulator